MTKKKFDAIVGEGKVNQEKILLVKPQTYMNLSGVSISKIVDFYQLDVEDVIVIYDDIDIELGKIRIRKSGSPGTHNGMRNITQMLATEDFPRIRIGTDQPKYVMNLADYVLMPISKEEDELFDLFILNEINGNNNKDGKTSSSGGGCLTCVLLFCAVPVGVVILAASFFM